MNRLALGTVQFGLKYGVANRGERVSIAEAKRILQLSRDSGMDTVDTAIAYGDSEARLGEAGVQDLHVITKLPAIPDHCPDVKQWVRQSVDESLGRLKVDRLEGLLLHRPLELLTPAGGALYKSLQQLKRDGLVNKIGISIYDPAELDAVCKNHSIDLVQAPFHVLDRRLIESGWMDRLVAQGTELHVRSVFLQGLLLMSAADRPPYFAQWKPLWQQWDQWLEERKMHPLAACLGYALSFPQIAKIVVGVDRREQLSSIVASAQSAAIDWPKDLFSDDRNLLDPSRWKI